MAVRPRLQVDGLNDLRRDLRRVDAALIGEVKTLNFRAGELVAAEGRRRVPRRSGTLAASIRPAKQAAAAVVRAGSARVAYAKYVHWGSKHNPRPVRFLYGAVDARRDDVIRMYRAGLERIIRRAN